MFLPTTLFFHLSQHLPSQTDERFKRPEEPDMAINYNEIAVQSILNDFSSLCFIS